MKASTHTPLSVYVHYTHCQRAAPPCAQLIKTNSFLVPFYMFKYSMCTSYIHQIIVVLTELNVGLMSFQVNQTGNVSETEEEIQKESTTQRRDVLAVKWWRDRRVVL